MPELVGQREIGGERTGLETNGITHGRHAIVVPRLALSSCAPLAQLAEQLTLNQWVPGSSPGGCTEEPLFTLASGQGFSVSRDRAPGPVPLAFNAGQSVGNPRP